MFGRKKKIHYVSPGDNSMSPDQLRDWQDTLNKAVKDLDLQGKVIVLPAGSKVKAK